MSDSGNIASSNARAESFISLLDNASEGILALDSEWRIEYMNAAAASVIGFRKESLIGTVIWESLPLIANTGFEDMYRRVARLGAAESSVEFFRPHNRWYEVRAVPWSSGIGVFFRDVTAERAREARYRMLSNSVPVLVWMADEDGTIEFLNDRWLEQMGEQPGAGRRTLWSAAVHPDDESRCHSSWQTAVHERAPYEVECRLRGADGLYRWFIRRAVPVADADGRTRWFGTSMNIDDRKRAEHALERHAEELARSNEHLQQFAWAAAHDLQEPMRNVSLYTQLLARTVRIEDERTRVCMTELLEGATRMQRLLRDLLAWAQATDAPDQSALSADPNIILEEVLQRMDDAVAASGALVTVRELPAAGVHECHLRTIFEQLLDNALRYRGPEPPRIHIGGWRAEGRLIFSVSDNGAGIRREYRESIFGVFRRLHGREVPGNGMGLAICARIVSHYGGRIWVESLEGRGSTFYFTLPSAC